METKQILSVDKDWFGFGYDKSSLHDGRHFLVEATFKLETVDSLRAAYAKGRRDEIVRHRNRRYPRARTCGSFFKNFCEKDIPFLIGDRKIVYAAYYLDKIGVKGALKIGGAVVSSYHANMLVTQANATSNDVISLARKMQELVLKEFGLVLQPECRLVGFKEYPLLR